MTPLSLFLSHSIDDDDEEVEREEATRQKIKIRKIHEEKEDKNIQKMSKQKDER